MIKYFNFVPLNDQNKSTQIILRVIILIAINIVKIRIIGRSSQQLSVMLVLYSNPQQVEINGTHFYFEFAEF